MSTRLQIPTQASARPAIRAVPLGILQRKCACGGSGGAGGEFQDCKKNKMSLQRHRGEGSEPSRVPPIVYDVLRSPGQPLDSATRTFFEPRFGHDFSRVRVHGDARAAESARAVNALAYTVGSHIAFDTGQYSPGTPTGQWLLAHELAHTLQQSPATSGDLRVGSPADPAESEADHAARNVVMGHAAPCLTPTAGRLHRFLPSLPSLPPPGPGRSRIVICNTSISGVPGLFRHLFIVYHNGSTDDEFYWRGGNTKGKSVCPGVGLSFVPPHPYSPMQDWLRPASCPFNDPSLGAIGVGPLGDPFKPGAGDWPALARHTLLMGPGADSIGTGTCFKQEADRISKACVPYSPCGPNSNSVAYTLLRNCGISSPTPPPGSIYPGWGILL